MIVARRKSRDFNVLVLRVARPLCDDRALSGPWALERPGSLYGATVGLAARPLRLLSSELSEGVGRGGA